MEYLKFLLETTEDLNIQRIYAHADEAVNLIRKSFHL